MSQVEFDGRGIGRSPSSTESQPLGEFLSTILKYLPFILLGSVLAGAAVFMLTTPKPPEPVATARVGLTEQVVWPFFDTARQRAVTIVEDEEFVTELRTLLQATQEIVVEAQMPDNQAFVNIIARADTSSNAAVVANEAAHLLLNKDNERVRAKAQSEFDAANDTLTASEERVAQLDSDLDKIVAEEAEARTASALVPGSQERRARHLRAELERNRLTQLRAEELRRQVELVNNANQAESLVASFVPELEILETAEVGDGEQEGRSFIPPIAALLGSLVVGVALAITWDRVRGTLSSRWHADQVAGVPVLAEMTAKSWERSMSLFLSSLLDTGENQGNIVAVTGLKGTPAESWLAIILYYFEAAGYRVMAVTESDGTLALGNGGVASWDEVKFSRNRRESLSGVSTINLPTSMSLLDTNHVRPILRDVADNCHLVLVSGGTLSTRKADQALALADTSIILARRNANRVDELREAAHLLWTMKRNLLGVVLTTPKLPNTSYVESRSPSISGLSNTPVGATR